MHGSQRSIADILMLVRLEFIPCHQAEDSTGRVGGHAFRGAFGGNLEASGGTSGLPDIAASRVGQRHRTGCASLRP